MNIIKKIVVLLFAAIIILPMVFFNFKPDSISMIDNRKLTDNPFGNSDNLTGHLNIDIENYINDRIGFREDMILGYTILNDKLFHKMKHPGYTYGKDGYVFGGGLEFVEYGDYHDNFIKMVKSIQNYCQDRNVPFLFVFNPAKPAIYTDKIENGINYDREWVDIFMNKLDEQGINYLDNTDILREATENGEIVFNQKYDANHWNDLGAFYGTNSILSKMKEQNDNIKINSLSDFKLSKKHVDTLLVSEFPIDEYIPDFYIKKDLKGIGERYGSIRLNDNYKSFGYVVNEYRKSEDLPKTLMFQGSYMNGYGSKYMQNALEEYIFVHDYQNVIDMPYYFNIFKPEFVVFEVGEYTINDGYFNEDKIKGIDYNPTLSSVINNENIDKITVNKDNLSISIDKSLTSIKWTTDINAKYVWLKSNGEYDMEHVDGGYEVTIDTSNYNKFNNDIEIYYLK